MIRLTAEPTLIPTSQGGKSRPIIGGGKYRPQFSVDSPEISTSFFVDVIQDRAALAPGETAIVEGQLLRPELFQGRLIPGARFEIREGKSIVGRGVLRSVVVLPTQN